VLVALNGARKKARTAKRVADLAQIQKALELYYADNGQYPANSGWASQCTAWGGVTADHVVYDPTANKGIVATYISAFPKDPLMNASASTSCYLYYSNGTDYKLLDHNVTENSASDYLAYPNFMDPARDGGSNGCTIDGTTPWSWAVYTPGGACW
jgi:Type II secretion system (T2SS), protein G